MTKRERLGLELGKCRGKWVATDDDHLIASGRTFKEVEKKVEALGVKNPIVFQVPDIKKKGHYFF